LLQTNPKPTLKIPIISSLIAIGLIVSGTAQDLSKGSKNETLFVQEYWTGKVRSVDQKGNVQTYVVGDSQATGLCFDRSGNLYTLGWANGKVARFSPTKTKTYIASNAYQSWYWPNGVAVDSKGNIYFGTDGGGTIQKIDNFGNLSQLCTGFQFIDELKIDKDDNLYVSWHDLSGGNGGITKITITPRLSLKNIITNVGQGCYDIALNSKGVVYVTVNPVSNTEGAILEIQKDGTARQYVTGLSCPYGIVFDRNDNLYVTESPYYGALTGGYIIKIEKGGKKTSLFASDLDNPGRLIIKEKDSSVRCDNDSEGDR